MATPRSADSLAQAQAAHHRVRNNLQLIASLVSLQARDAGTAEARRVFDKIGVQIHALALVESWVHERDDDSGIDLAAMMADLCAMLQASLVQGETGRIEISHDVGAVALHGDQALPLALLVTEFAMRAARPDSPGPVPVHVGVEADGGMISLTLRAPVLAGGAAASRLAVAMTRQLGATLRDDAAMGCWTIGFPVSSA